MVEVVYALRGCADSRRSRTGGGCAGGRRARCLRDAGLVVRKSVSENRTNRHLGRAALRWPPNCATATGSKSTGHSWRIRSRRDVSVPRQKRRRNARGLTGYEPCYLHQASTAFFERSISCAICASLRYSSSPLALVVVSRPPLAAFQLAHLPVRKFFFLSATSSAFFLSAASRSAAST